MLCAMPPSVAVFVADSGSTETPEYRLVAKIEGLRTVVQLPLLQCVGTHLRLEFEQRPQRTNKNPNGQIGLRLI